MVEAARGAGFTKVSERLVTDWRSLGLLDEPVRVSRGQGEGPGARYEWPDTQRELFLSLLQQRPNLKYVAGLSQMPVSIWIYWGDDFVPLRQVKIALRTWWDRAGRLNSRERIESEARVIVKAIVGAGGSRELRNQLRDAIAKSMDSGVYDVESITPLVQNLLETIPQGSWGPFGFGASEVVDMLRSMAIAMTDFDSFSDGDFLEARSRHRQNLVAYLRAQPALSDEPAWGNWFIDPTYEFLVNNSCRDLLRNLGMLRLAAQYGRDLGPVTLESVRQPPPEVLQLPIR